MRLSNARGPRPLAQHHAAGNLFRRLAANYWNIALRDKVAALPEQTIDGDFARYHALFLRNPDGFTYQTYRSAYADQDPVNWVSSHSLWNLSGSYSGFHRLTLIAGVKNLLDKDPRFQTRGPCFRRATIRGTRTRWDGPCTCAPASRFNPASGSLSRSA